MSFVYPHRFFTWVQTGVQPLYPEDAHLLNRIWLIASSMSISTNYLPVLISLSWRECYFGEQGGMAMSVQWLSCQTDLYGICTQKTWCHCAAHLQGLCVEWMQLLFDFSRALMDDIIMPVPLSMSDLLQLQSYVDPKQNFIKLLHEDLLQSILSLLDFDDIVSMAHTTSHFWSQIWSLMRRRLLANLGHLFKSSTDNLLELLQFTGGCVAGQVITMIFDMLMPIADFPRDINVFILPKASWSVLVFLRDNLCFHNPHCLTLDNPLYNLTDRVYRWCLPVSIILFFGSPVHCVEYAYRVTFPSTSSSPCQVVSCQLYSVECPPQTWWHSLDEHLCPSTQQQQFDVLHCPQQLWWTTLHWILLLYRLNWM